MSSYDSYLSRIQKATNNEEEAMALLRLTCLLGALTFTKDPTKGGYLMRISREHVENTVSFYLTLKTAESGAEQRFFVKAYSDILMDELEETYKEFQWLLKSVQSDKNDYAPEDWARAVMANSIIKTGGDPELDAQGFNIFHGMKPKSLDTLN